MKNIFHTIGRIIGTISNSFKEGMNDSTDDPIKVSKPSIPKVSIPDIKPIINDVKNKSRRLGKLILKASLFLLILSCLIFIGKDDIKSIYYSFQPSSQSYKDYNNPLEGYGEEIDQIPFINQMLDSATKGTKNNTGYEVLENLGKRFVNKDGGEAIDVGFDGDIDIFTMSMPYGISYALEGFKEMYGEHTKISKGNQEQYVWYTDQGCIILIAMSSNKVAVIMCNNESINKLDQYLMIQN